MAGVDARRATPPDPSLPRRGLAGCREPDPSHPALVTGEDAKVEPSRKTGGFLALTRLAPQANRRLKYWGIATQTEALG